MIHADTTSSSAGYRRVALLTAAAAVLYGSWATVANASHGIAVAGRAGAVQGLSSAFTTLIISGLAETIFVAARTPPWSARWRVALTAGIPPLCSSSVHVVAHLLNGTPELVRTIFPSVVMGFVFGGIYAWRLARGASSG
jgi:hypothetical protein